MLKVKDDVLLILKFGEVIILCSKVRQAIYQFLNQ